MSKNAPDVAISVPEKAEEEIWAQFREIEISSDAE